MEKYLTFKIMFFKYVTTQIQAQLKKINKSNFVKCLVFSQGKELKFQNLKKNFYEIRANLTFSYTNLFCNIFENDLKLMNVKYMN